MHFRLPSPLSRFTAGLGLVRAALGLLAAAPLAQARFVESEAAAQAAPPPFTLQKHVLNGCHLSTITFLARFHAEFPAERGEAVILIMRNEGGTVKAHTVALVSWHGSWWGRDEYFGVLPLGRSVEAKTDWARLTARLQAVLERRAREIMSHPTAERPPPPPAILTAAERLREVVAATRIIPFPSRIFWVGSGAASVPVALFRPNPGQIAVYDPAHGTCVAETGLSDDARVVALVAARLGYGLRPVHPDLALAGGILVAADHLRLAALPR